MAMSCPARWPWLLCPMDAAPVPPCPDSFLGAQQTYTCSHSCVGGMKRWSRWLSLSWVWIGPIMAEFCFSLCSSIFLGRRPVVQEQSTCMVALQRWWLCTGVPSCSRTSRHWWQCDGGWPWDLGPPAQEAEEGGEHWVGEASGQYLLLTSIFTCWSHVCLTLRHPVLWINLTQSHLFINNTGAV